VFTQIYREDRYALAILWTVANKLAWWTWTDRDERDLSNVMTDADVIGAWRFIGTARNWPLHRLPIGASRIATIYEHFIR
jgi:hypothetical protein